MSNLVLDNLKKFIIEEGWGENVQLKLETTIESDIGITGDDADDFLISYGKKFNVDVSKFPIGDYFEDEGDRILPAIIRVITGRKKRQRKLLTIAHLEKGILAGRLDDEVINS